MSNEIYSEVVLESTEISSKSDVNYESISSNILINNTQILNNSKIEATNINSNSEIDSTSINSSSKIEIGLQGPPGEAGSDAEASLLTGQNNDSVVIQKGHIVCIDNSGTGFLLADKANTNNPAVGMAIESAAPGYSLKIRIYNEIELSDWSYSSDSIDLIPNARYFLSEQGKMSPVASILSGDMVQFIGTSISFKKFLLNIDRPIIRSI